LKTNLIEINEIFKILVTAESFIITFLIAKYTLKNNKYVVLKYIVLKDELSYNITMLFS